MSRPNLATIMNRRLLELLNQTATGGEEVFDGLDTHSTFEFTEPAMMEFTELVIAEVLDAMDIPVTSDWKEIELQRLTYLISRLHVKSRKRA